MAFYTGYVDLPTSTYDVWKSAVNGNGYDADGYYGCQCWDLCAEFWWNVGFPQGYPLTGTNHYASECWSQNRYNNISYGGTQYVDLIENLSDVKRGDVIVWGGSSGYPTGHIGFADEDYNGSGSIAVLGQNQGSGGTPPPISHPNGGTTANVKTLGTINFLGAFRYREWEDTPPTPPITRSKGSFKWVLMARKLNQMRNQL